MSESSTASAHKGLLPRLEELRKELETAHERVKRLVMLERRARRPDDAQLLATLEKVTQSMTAVKEGLDEFVPEKPAENKRKKVASSPRKRDLDEEGSGVINAVRREKDIEEDATKEPHERPKQRRNTRYEPQDEDKEKEEEEEEEVEVKRRVSVKPNLLDGKSVRFNGNLVYFSKTNQREGKLWVCPVFAVDGELKTILVDERQVRPVPCDDEQKKQWCKTLLQTDIQKRFELNAKALFANNGMDMMDVRFKLLQDNVAVTEVMDSFMLKVEGVSKGLCIVNNTALMLVATLWKESQGGGAVFDAKVLELSNRCQLTHSTLVRYRSIGELMLKSKLVACMLPSFVALHEGEFVGLLNDENVAVSWEMLYERKVKGMQDALTAPEIGDLELGLDSMRMEAHVDLAAEISLEF